MHYSENFDNLKTAPSRLGYGCMRFPTKDGKIDMEKAEALLDKAYASGVTYYDTAWFYHGGESEIAVGKIMSKYPRDTYNLATKLPMSIITSRDHAAEVFAKQLEKLQTDHFDFYLLHCLDKSNWAKVKEMDILSLLDGYKAEGKIINLGFSFHDDYQVFEDIVKYRKWDFCQIQYNYMDTDEQAGDKGYQLVNELGIPLVIMEPLRGGTLANLPEDATTKLREARPDASVASWGMRWLISKDNCKVILSGMTEMNQLEDNLKTFDACEPLSDKEQELVKDLAKALRARVFNGCTGCSYCMPCPAGVNIPRNFRIWNEYGMYGNRGGTVWNYFSNMEESAHADHCVKCGACEKVCPQHISIRENLVSVSETMNSLKG